MHFLRVSSLIKYETYALPCHFHISVSRGLDSRIREKYPGAWDEMLSKAIEHFVQWPYSKWGGSQKGTSGQFDFGKLLTLVKKRKWRLFGHVSSWAKTILHDTVKEKRRRGGQKKRFEDNVKSGLCQFNKDSWKQDKLERDCCEVIYGAPKILQGYRRE